VAAAATIAPPHHLEVPVGAEQVVVETTPTELLEQVSLIQVAVAVGVTPQPNKVDLVS
jgi:hypothetical protein